MSRRNLIRKSAAAVMLPLFTACYAIAQPLPGFAATVNFDEQECNAVNERHKYEVCINAPQRFNTHGRTFLILYALPNGNSIEWTKGKQLQPGDDWHYDIQHIAAQTRFVRRLDKKNNYIVAYVMAAQKSWPAWKRSTPDAATVINGIVDSIAHLFSQYQPRIVLNGHSGGGSFIFGYIDAQPEIPQRVERIAFLDSDYGFEDSLHTRKLAQWLQGKRHQLLVLAYNDSVVMYNGKPLVSPTGGTWYRSRWMQRSLVRYFNFTATADTVFIVHKGLNGRIEIWLKQNPGGLIYHTVQVERNGFILSLLSGTRYNRRKHFVYFGKRAYGSFIPD